LSHKKAFVLHHSDQDLASLKPKVDEVIIVVKGRFSPFNPTDLFKKIQENVTSFDTEADYVVPVGSTVANFLAGVALGLKQPKKIKLCILDSRNNHYKEVVLKLEGHNGK